MIEGREWNGEDWVDFHWAADEFGDKLGFPGLALVRLRKACASGVIRTITYDAAAEEAPEPIPPSRWRAEDDVDQTGPGLVAVRRPGRPGGLLPGPGGGFT
jgi:hypothetical protein